MIFAFVKYSTKSLQDQTNPLKREDLDEFVESYNPANRHQREETWSPENPEGRWRVYKYDELIARCKASLDIFWLKDDSLADSDNLPRQKSSRRKLSMILRRRWSSFD